MSLTHPKAQIIDSLLAQGMSVNVMLDSRREGVRVPQQHLGKRCLVLLFGWRLAVPIDDLAVTDSAVTDSALSGTLSFGRVPHYVYIPWSAVYGFSDNDTGRGALWVGCAPWSTHDVGPTQPSPQQAQQAQPKKAATKRELPSYLRVVK